jgi:hypothetical protein
MNGDFVKFTSKILDSMVNIVKRRQLYRELLHVSEKLYHSVR